MSMRPCSPRLFLRLCSLLLATSPSHAQMQDGCLGHGFTQTLPPREVLSRYSTTVLRPGEMAIYTALSFRCDGMLHSLTIPSQVRGSDFEIVDNYLEPRPCLWRFNDTGYYLVLENPEMQPIPGTPLPGTYGQTIPLGPDAVLSFNFTIMLEMDVQAADVLGFRLHYAQADGRIEHLPLLYKPGPIPGDFIPIVIASFMPDYNTSTATDGASSTLDLPTANGTALDADSYDLYIGIIAAVCQVEVIVVAIVTGLIAHFITRRCTHKPIPSQDRAGSAARLVQVKIDNRPWCAGEPVGRDAPTGIGGGEDVVMQPCPAYQTHDPIYH